MKRIGKTFVVLLLSACLLMACNQDENEDKITLEIFSNKPLCMSLYQSLIEEFGREHPTIHIKFQVLPESYSVIRTQLPRNKLPDILSIPADALYGELG